MAKQISKVRPANTKNIPAQALISVAKNARLECAEAFSEACLDASSRPLLYSWFTCNTCVYAIVVLLSIHTLSQL